jgi:hypothetical protein
VFKYPFYQYPIFGFYLTITACINTLIMSHGEAIVLPNENLIDIQKYSKEVVEEKISEIEISKEDVLQFSQAQIENNIISQTITPEAVQSFPKLNDIPLPEQINPAEKIESNPAQPEQKQPDIPNEQIDNPSEKKKVLELYILNSISNSAKKYPWFVNPTDSFTFSPDIFNPLQNNKYINFDAKFAQEKLTIDKFTIANFPKQEQFYWMLSNNRIVIETKGVQVGILYQGESTELENKKKLRLSQALWGMQAITVLPQRFRDLDGSIEQNNFSIQSTAAELETPEGTVAPQVTISNDSNTNTNTNNSNSILALPVNPQIGSGSSRNSEGGGILFENLDAKNAPQFIQAFPTNNLQGLLDVEGLFKGAFIPKTSLEKIGLAWENPATGAKAKFQPETTSIPGIKIAQSEKSDNLDLLNILVNPFISTKQRENYYLNSLFWVSLGQRKPVIIKNTDTQDKYNWHRLYFNNPHNRTLLQHDSQEAKATYYNVFSNPGFSLSFSFNKWEVNKLQTANATLGLLIGGIFDLVVPPKLEESLQEAKTQYNQQANLASLNTKATPEERKQINQRLNRTLLFGNIASSIEQISGKLAFASSIRPNNSSIWQICTGNYRRLAQFIEQKTKWEEGDTYISKSRLSNDDFGNLTFIGSAIPLEQTGIKPKASNHSYAAQIALTDSNGQQFVQDFSSADITFVPMNIRSFDIASDRIELMQDGLLKNKFNIFKGSLYLPTIETLWSGSSKNWNYGISSGIWFNLNPTSAFNVGDNNIGTQEPGLGIYINGLLNLVSSHVSANKNGTTKSVNSHIPSIRIHWNSAKNPLNPAYLSLNYAFSHQTSNFNYSLRTGINFADNNLQISTSKFVLANLGWNTGLQINGTIELSNKLFYSLEALQKIDSNYSLGAYIKNFYNTNQGLNNRVSDLSYGLIFTKTLSNGSNFWESRFGKSGDNFEAKLEGGLRF